MAEEVTSAELWDRYMRPMVAPLSKLINEETDRWLAENFEMHPQEGSNLVLVGKEKNAS